MYRAKTNIGSSDGGKRMKYTVKWLEWSMEQESWCLAAEHCIGGPEQVTEYEQRELRRLQTVHILRGVKVKWWELRVRWTAANQIRVKGEPQSELVREIDHWTVVEAN